MPRAREEYIPEENSNAMIHASSILFFFRQYVRDIGQIRLPNWRLVRYFSRVRDLRASSALGNADSVAG